MLLLEVGVKFIGVKNGIFKIDESTINNTINSLLNIEFEKGVLKLSIINVAGTATVVALIVVLKY
ncbi:hypothetical protein SCA6_015387 [Theobroma cacao]